MAKKYIDADVLVKKMMERGWRHPDETTREFVEDDLPAADVVEVVRCKDCMFWQRDHISCEGYARCQTGEGGIRFRREYDFCSVARRRTDG